MMTEIRIKRSFTHRELVFDRHKAWIRKHVDTDLLTNALRLKPEEVVRITPTAFKGIDVEIKTQITKYTL